MKKKPAKKQDHGVYNRRSQPVFPILLNAEDCQTLEHMLEGWPDLGQAVAQIEQVMRKCPQARGIYNHLPKEKRSRYRKAPPE
jgi:hypothetical protein